MELNELISVIESSPDATAAADVADWTGVLAALTAETVEQRTPGLISMATALGALQAAGHDPNVVLTAFESSALGRSGMQKLAAEGLDFGHPLTIGLVDVTRASGGITAEAAQTLKELSIRMVSPLAAAGFVDAAVDEADIQSAWQHRSSLQLQQNWQQRAGEAINQAGTVEQADGVAALRTIADEIAATSQGV